MRIAKTMYAIFTFGRESLQMPVKKADSRSKENNMYADRPNSR